MNKTGADSDEINQTLFDARNFYYIGNFLNCINTVVPEQSTGTPELLAYAYYAYLAIDSGRLISGEIKENNPTALIAFRHVLDYIEKPAKREEIVQYFVEKVQEQQQGTKTDDTNIWLIAAAIVFCREELYDNALKSLHGIDDLECMAVTIQCLLKLNRVDLAKQMLTKMQEKSDDATLTQLAQAWVGIALGGEHITEAYHIFQEFCDKYSPTPLLLNGKAVCHIGQEKYEDAEDVLKEALAKKHNDYDTLINMIVLSHLTGKGSEVANRYIEQLKQFYPDSSFVTDYSKKEDEFDRLSLQYEANIKITPNVH